MTTAASALDRLPRDVRDRLNAFAEALDRVPLAELPMYVAIQREPAHGRAVETAQLVAIEAGLDDAVAAARRAIEDAMLRLFAQSKLRVGGIFGVGMATTSGPVGDTARIVRSLEDAVTAIVLGDHLGATDRDELLGLWDRLLP
jgi:predicted transcriptional regulator